MEQYKVVVTPSADQDLEEIFEYIATQLKVSEIASNLILKLYDSMQSLSTMPKRCPLSKDRFLAKQGFRTMLTQNYIIFYVIDKGKEQVIIHRILYAKRNYTALFVYDSKL